MKGKEEAPLCKEGFKTEAMDTSSTRRRCKNPCLSSSASSEERDWAALPHDVLFDIFLRLKSCEIMWGAEAVCKAWCRVTAEEPKLWRHIHITDVPEWSSIDIAVRYAVDCSAGLCEAFSGPWDEESLLYLAERSPSLKSLHISHDQNASYKVLIETIKKLPLLEDLDISPPFQHICSLEKFFESVCKARPLLKNLKINFTMPSDYSFDEAVVNEDYMDGDIYRTPVMCELCSIELSNIIFSYKAFSTLPDNCPLLDALNISGFFNFTMDAQLRAKCARVKNLILPYYSDTEYEEDEETEEDEDD